MSEFKAAVTPKQTAPTPEPENPDHVLSDQGETAPIALYQEINKIPFTAKHFEIEKIWDSPDLSFKEDVELIESIYRQRVAANEIEDGEDTYKAFIKEAEKATNSKNSPASVKIPKIAEFLRFMSKMDEIDRNRRMYAN